MEILQHLKFSVAICCFVSFRRVCLMLAVIVLMLAGNTPVYAQSARVTIKKQQAAIDEILQEIESQTNYLFINNNNVKLDRRVNVSAENEPVSSVLKKILEGIGAEFVLQGSHIVLTNKVQKSSPSRTLKAENRSGRVVDAGGKPIVGATVILSGTTVGTTTDSEGRFMIRAAQGNTLEFSCLGYDPARVTVGSKSKIDVTLQESTSTLDDVVIVGYGVQKKANLTGAVAAIRNEEIGRRPVMRATTALQGLASGVTVTQSTGQPGSDGATIRIRGIGTLNNSEPLVLIDGVAGALDGVNPNDIESISVLKDAASAAIYGSRAANGVILVQTRQGTRESLSASYNGYIGFQSATVLPDFVSNYEYMTNMNKASVNAGMSPLYSESYLADWLRYRKVDPDHYPDNDWQKILLTGSGFTQNHHVSVSGGGKAVRAFASFAYQSQEGIMENFFADRFSARANISMDITKFLNASMIVDGRRSTTEFPTYQWFMKGYINRIPGIYTCLLSDGRYGTGYNQRNPLALGREGGNTVNTYDNLRATFSLTLTPAEGLSIDFNYTPNLGNTYKKIAKKSVAVYEPDQETPAAISPAKSSLSQSDAKTTQTTIQALIHYDRSFKGGHDLGVLAGYEQIKYHTNDISLSREGYVLPQYEVINAGSTENMQNGGSASAWALLSYFGRINYSYKSRYLFEANVRVDGSSRFARGHRYGVFPSFSAGWRISEESFLQGVNWISNLKLRASWGRLGNQEIGTYPAYTTITFDPTYTFGGTPADGGYQKAFANTNISWESSETTDIGLDIGLFKNKLTASFDYYVKNTTGILLKLPVASITGLTEPYQNAGKVRNTGWDFEISHQNKVGDFSYSITFNLSDVHNKVTDLKGVDPIISGYTLIAKGYPINSLYGYVADGLFRDRVDLLNHPSQSYFGDYSLGDIKYRNLTDADGTEGEVNAYDRQVIGNQIPRYTFGLNISGSWKNFDFSLLFQGIGKRDIILTGDAVWALYSSGKMQRWMLDNWSPENPNASYPRLVAASSHNNFQYSSFWVYNAAFIRLKTAQVGYTLPTGALAKIGIRKLRVYVTGDNIFTSSSLPKGWDPEMGSGAADIYPLTKTWLGGIQLTF